MKIITFLFLISFSVFSQDEYNCVTKKNVKFDLSISEDRFEIHNEDQDSNEKGLYVDFINHYAEIKTNNAIIIQSVIHIEMPMRDIITFNKFTKSLTHKSGMFAPILGKTEFKASCIEKR